MKFLVTAGPTREPLDPVRYLSNHSSGKMGYSIARVLLDRGHEVALVSGPTALTPPRGCEFVQVETAREMLRACKSVWGQCDGLFAVAAVADWRPKTVSPRKLKRGEATEEALAMIPNPDIVRTLAKGKKNRLVVGFALESGRGLQEAQRKMADKNLDFVALNGPQAQGAAESKIRLLGAGGQDETHGPMDKLKLARALVRSILTTTPRA